MLVGSIRMHSKVMLELIIRVEVNAVGGDIPHELTPEPFVEPSCPMVLQYLGDLMSVVNHCHVVVLGSDLYQFHRDKTN